MIDHHTTMSQEPGSGSVPHFGERGTGTSRTLVERLSFENALLRFNLWPIVLTDVSRVPCTDLTGPPTILAGGLTSPDRACPRGDEPCRPGMIVVLDGSRHDTRAPADVIDARRGSRDRLTD